MSSKESSRDRLIRTASRLFQLQGYHGTGLNQILKESGAPKGSLYYHFPNGKEQLALESVELTAEVVSARIEQGLGRSSDAAEAIESFLKGMAEQFQKESITEGVPIATVALETALESELLRNACRRAYVRFQGLFEKKLLASGFEAERAKELSVVINSLVEGAFVTSFTIGSNEPLLLAAKQIPVLLK